MPISHAARSLILTNVLAAILLAGGLMAGTGQASAQDGRKWEVTGDIHGEPKKSGGFKGSEDVSGIACAGSGFPRLCIIADDEAQGAQVVVMTDGRLRAGDFVPLINDAFEGEKLELDAEGVAYADGWFYVIGSHGRARHEKDDAKKEALNNAKAEATRRVFRIRLEPGSVDMGTGRITKPYKTEGSRELGRIIQGQDRLRDLYDEALKDNGLTVEGIAARNGKLYVGMRGPVLSERNAVVMEVPIAAVFEGHKGDAVLHELDLGNDRQEKPRPRGIRDLVPHMDGFLVLAGPENDPKDDKVNTGDYTVFSWSGSGSGNKLDARFDLPEQEKAQKPEAIQPLEEKADDFQALLLFDGRRNGKPTAVQVRLEAIQ